MAGARSVMTKHAKTPRSNRLTPDVRGTVMPSTSKPQDAFKTPRPGTYTCKVCNVHDKGGQSAFYAHWLRAHFVPPVGVSHE